MTLKAELECLHSASFGWALLCCGGERLEAEEVLQSAYVKVLDGRASGFLGRSTFKTWLYSVIRLTAADQRRKRWFRRLLLDRARHEAEPLVPEVASDQRIARQEAAKQLTSCLALLPKRQREILHLVFYQDLTIAESAEVMKVSVGSARQHYHRGKKRLGLLLRERQVEKP